jgi:two-component system phosphate regulon sensor histidine kinase PhoR
MIYVLAFIVLAAFVLLHLWWKNRWLSATQEAQHHKRNFEQAERRHYAELTQYQAEQQAVFNSMAEGVLILDQGGRVQLVNRSLQELFGLKFDVRGQTIMESLRMKELAEINKRLSGERVVQVQELTLPGVNGRSVEVNAAAVFDRTGKQSGTILVFHDLTRLKQLESTRQEFVANVSHELRTPLSLIKGFVETLLSGAKDHPEHAAHFLQTIEKHTNRLTYLIEDLLTISRLESGQVSMNFQNVEIHPEVERVVDDLISLAEGKKVEICNQVPEQLCARADADRLHQVLFNLIENAIKYGKESGHVVIGAKIFNDHRDVEMWVTDDGPGIPADAKERIFERFYRVDRARSRETGGTGLGLSIVKHIVQAHGGKLWVDSTLGKGSTFHLTLPGL